MTNRRSTWTNTKTQRKILSNEKERSKKERSDETYENEIPVQIPEPDADDRYLFDTKRQKKRTIVIVLLLLVTATAITLSELNGGPLPTWDELGSLAVLTEPPVVYSRCLAVHFIDVGQGDSILIEAPNGDTMLIDAGERGNEKTVTEYIKQYGDDTLEYVVATHPHSDHIGSMDDVINSFTVRNVLMPRLSKANTPTHSFYKSFLTAVRKSGAATIAAKPGYTFSLGKGTCTVLSPARQSDDLNNMSVVLRLDWGNTSFLFTGDAESAVEKELLNGDYAQYLDASVLKLGHHGSNTSSTMSFLNAVSPAYSVISCGAGNDYGHPHRETMEKLSKLDTTVLRTDTMGSIRMYSDGETIYVETDNG